MRISLLLASLLLLQSSTALGQQQGAKASIEGDGSFRDPNGRWSVRHFFARSSGYSVKSIKEFQKARALTGNSLGILGLLGYGYGMAGMKGEAQGVLKESDKLSRQNGYVSSFCKVTVYIGLGEKNRAFEWLDGLMRNDSGIWGCLQLTRCSTRCDMQTCSGA